MKSTQQYKILSMLRNNPSGITSRDMVELGIFKYSSRIAELRAKGHIIKAHRVKKNLWLYKLEGEPKKTLNANEANAFLESLSESKVEQETLL